MIADHGIREAVFSGNMRDINLILENIVYLELLRRGYEVTVGRTGDKKTSGRLESAAKGDYARSDGVPDFAAASHRGKREAKTVGYYLSVAGQ